MALTATSPDKIDLALERCAKQAGLLLVGERSYGWQKKSAGSVVRSHDGSRAWLRVHGQAVEAARGWSWSGVQDSRLITGVRKPTLLQVQEWKDENWIWRGEIMSLVDAPVCSPTPELRKELVLADSWFAQLRVSLTALGSYKTERVNTRQDLVTRRIRERFGDSIDAEVSQWITVHGDIHWANLTESECWILDWEGWGRGPVGLDAAFLYAFSLLEPASALRVNECFADQLETRDGILSQLFVCSELLRMTEIYGDHPDLKPHLLELAERALSSLNHVAPPKKPTVGDKNRAPSNSK